VLTEKNRDNKPPKSWQSPDQKLKNARSAKAAGWTEEHFFPDLYPETGTVETSKERKEDGQVRKSEPPD